MSNRADLSRRSFLKSVAAGAGAVSVPAALTGCFGDDDDDKRDLTVFVFGHGVASGDPLADAVIIWTRVTPSDTGAEAQVGWVVATDEAMSNVVASGSVYTDSRRDFTVKVDVTGLNADTLYYYQFAGKDGAVTPVGQTRTLPVGSVDSVKLAVCSCANLPAGYFNVYNEIANSDADVVVHLGDYIYEYGANEYPPAAAQVRDPDPLVETLTLTHYRARYAKYRTDTALQLAHQKKPFICVWDDHELANDTWKGGAENHDEDEGSFEERRAAAIQAYHEWLPIRSGSDTAKIWRAFEFGNLVNLTMLDTRMYARDKPLDYKNYLVPGTTDIDADAFAAALGEQSRGLLGSEQQQFAIGSIFNNNATWQVLGQQVLMGRITIPQTLLALLGELTEMLEAGISTEAQQQALLAQQGKIEAKLIELYNLKGTDPDNAVFVKPAPYNLDAWDGYFPAREQILRRAQYFNKNLVVLAGDSHNAWASDLYTANDSGEVQHAAGSVGVEFATSSVTSPGFETYVGFGTDAVKQAQFEAAVTTLVDDLKYFNAAQRGYMLVEFTPAKSSCEWIYVDTITSETYTASVQKKMEVKPGQGKRTLTNVPLVS
ncbi:alkaline phosphatase D family protein [Thalassolituus alkanivorans]|uniref:alkaline phosphatase D family protein n=1 Tax=Thalassolituus alkanivorans TaxID=2881055 RepID=UPI001E654FCE|nr:alkaline phosphatase D family protein [Thalassolituus alkanivorans]MCB2385138.1 alkaline phosphatase D family protein [Thalassolituus alkanivorans]MCB2423419.1 alkaline phosphatase D family protein [Thalassolituus alkanivorans]